MEKWHKIGCIVSLVSWFVSWIILAIKLDWVLFICFVLYGLGLSGIIIWFIMIPELNKLKEVENE